jgi:hypothetical protein
MCPNLHFCLRTFLIFLLSVIFVIKVKLALCLIKHHGVKFYRVAEGSSISILLSVIHPWKCVHSFPAAFTLSLRKERWANIKTYAVLKFTYFLGTSYFWSEFSRTVCLRNFYKRCHYCSKIKLGVFSLLKSKVRVFKRNIDSARWTVPRWARITENFRLHRLGNFRTYDYYVRSRISRMALE